MEHNVTAEAVIHIRWGVTGRQREMTVERRVNEESLVLIVASARLTSARYDALSEENASARLMDARAANHTLLDAFHLGGFEAILSGIGTLTDRKKGRTIAQRKLNSWKDALVHSERRKTQRKRKKDPLG